MADLQSTQSPNKKWKRAKKEKAPLHVVMPRDINEGMTESPTQMRKKAKKEKASKQDVLAGDMNQRIYNSTSRGESSKQGTKRIEKEKASIYAALTRNENGGVRFIDSTTKGPNQGTRNAEKGKASLYVERGSEINGARRSDSLANPVAIDEYGIAEVYKKCQLQKVAKSWREHKHRLRVKHYDKYDNDDERKRHCPEGVKREDWDRFVDNEAKPSRKRMRLVGKNSRKALKSLHTSGRRGAARTIHNLKKKNPNVKITRTHSYMAIHTRKDGSFLAPERMAYGLLEDDSEWNDAMKQASEWANPTSLRELFVTLILLCEKNQPQPKSPNLSEDRIKNDTLCEIENIMVKSTAVGYGAAARDHLGEVVFAFCGGSGRDSVLFQELEAIEKGLQGCQLHGFWRVDVCSDYLFREYQ
ncbi:hypothetical protein IFM89_015795 [Coptis chinensis]|uniref:RNase H type-1 domain-containing protein n=1 Tax=Coptis chinensis TaxID=261450 RepID=A0A835IQD3_9MAGN|nr:hypothetical protein IFM89_015795 [Coptis chinensis]